MAKQDGTATAARQDRSSSAVHASIPAARSERATTDPSAAVFIVSNGIGHGVVGVLDAGDDGGGVGPGGTGADGPLLEGVELRLPRPPPPPPPPPQSGGERTGEIAVGGTGRGRDEGAGGEEEEEEAGTPAGEVATLRSRMEKLLVASWAQSNNGSGVDGDGGPGGTDPPDVVGGSRGVDGSGSGSGKYDAHRPQADSIESVASVSFSEAPTSARVMVGSYSIGGEEFWGASDDDGDDEDGGGGGGTSGGYGYGDGGGVGCPPSPAERRRRRRPNEDEGSPYTVAVPHRGQEGGAGGGPSPGGAGVGGGDTSKEGGDGGLAPAPKAEGEGVRERRGGGGGDDLNVDEGGGDGGGGRGGAGGEGAGGGLRRGREVERAESSPAEGRPLGEVRLVRSTVDTENLQPPSLLRPTSKYVNEDLAEAKRRQNQ